MLHGIAQFNALALNIADRPLSTSTAMSSFDLLLAIRLYRLGVFGFSVVFLCSTLNCKHSYLSFKCTIHPTIQRRFFSSFLSRNMQSLLVTHYTNTFKLISKEVAA